MLLAPGTLLKNRYRIKRHIASGGMGAVYLADDWLKKKQRAVKQAFFSDDVTLLKSFEREAELLASLEHDSLPEVTDFFAEGQSYFLVMDYIEGQDLFEQLRQSGKPFALEMVLDWADQLLDVLEYLHMRQTPIVHRDIKPLNIKPAPNGRIMLLDFGIVKGALAEMTHGVGSVPSYTPAYAPLEQVIRADYARSEMQWIELLADVNRAEVERILKEDTDARSDLYALGATLYQLLTNELPPRAPSRALSLWNNRLDPLRSANEINTNVPPAVAAVLRDAMALKHDQRPTSATAMRAALKAAHQFTRLKIFEFDTVTLDAGGQVTARRKGRARHFVEDLGGGVMLELVEIPAGTLTMGSPASEEGRRDNEGPQHQVTVPKFYMGKYQVTQSQWSAIMESNPSRFKGDDLPVENVSWDDAIEFCRELSVKTGHEYRLPTEVEWEYACRAGTKTPFAFGETITPEIVNYDGNFPYGNAPKGTYREKTVPVGSLGVANKFGLSDMHGNVWEWCLDYWHENYNGAPSDGSGWMSGGDSSRRVLRGGSWDSNGQVCRSAYRVRIAPGDHIFIIGVRVVVVSRT